MTSTIALKPYLDEVKDICDGLSHEELSNFIIEFAKELPTKERNKFLKKCKTYCSGEDILIEYLPFKNHRIDIARLKEYIEDQEGSCEFACILVQNPNYFGCIEEIFEISNICKQLKAKFIVCADPVSLALLKSPSEYGADIVVGDIQPLGIPMSFGGPHGGFMACKSEYLRQIPGRIAGMTVDRDGEKAFTLTLQTREQHIRRSKATSNICSNQALMTLAASVYLSVMGPEGLKEVVLISAQHSHLLADKINEIPGFKVVNSDFLYEFVVKIDAGISTDELLEDLESRNILAGIKLDDKFDSLSNHILVCVTEMNSINDIYNFVNALKEVSERYSLGCTCC